MTDRDRMQQTMPDELKPEQLDLIQMVQRGRMAHDAQAQPSQMTGVYWLEAKPLRETPPPTARAGEWRIPTTAAAMDALWARIKTATEAGELGYKSKISTTPAHGQAEADARMIVVRTRDADDSADVERVRAALRALGVDEAITYTRV
jgi:hypothetical protein